MLKLQEIISNLSGVTGILNHRDNVNVKGLSDDSREVMQDYVFIAYEGVAVDGNSFISKAVQSGASLIICENNAFIESVDVPVITVKNGRIALSEFASLFYNHPSRKMTVIGVTGTDGKTSTSNIIYDILRANGYNTGMISTVSAKINDQEIDTGFHVTTSDADDLQFILDKMVKAGVTHCVLETTSHALSQYRVEAVDFDAAVVTNITSDHLDYHKTRERYREAKGHLFEKVANREANSVDKKGVFVLNNDDDFSFHYLKSLAKIDTEVYTYSQYKNEALVTASSIKNTPSGLAFSIRLPDNGAFDISVKLTGLFNVSNILAAISTLFSMDLTKDQIKKGLTSVKPVPGRMEIIDHGQPFMTVVDFAHTPNSMKNALNSLREVTCNRLITVFGCAGNRDKVKRPLMGDISTSISDVVIITAEDPRTENIDDITREIKSGIVNSACPVYYKKDRGDAIAFAVEMAEEGDTVVVLGKGHEQSMCFGTKEFPWDDREAVRNALKNNIKKF